MLDIKENREDEVTSNEGATLSPEDQPSNNEGDNVQLNNSPTPTDEQVKDGASEDVNAEIGNPVATESAPEMTDEQKSVERLFNQKELNDIVGQRVAETKERTLKGLLDHYGCDSQEALDSLVGDGQRFPMLKGELDDNKKSSEARISELENSLRDVSSELALFKSNINPDRYEDVKLILKGKGLDITSDNIKNEMATHPEWENKPIIENAPANAGPAQSEPANAVMDQFEKIPENPEPESKISRLGNGKSGTASENEREEAFKYFG